MRFIKTKILCIFVVGFFIGPGAVSSSDLDQLSCVFKNKDTLYVGGDGPENYSSIQSAIDDAENCDTIYVYSGTYNENIDISWKSLTLKGEDKETTIIDGGGNGATIIISSSTVHIQGFTIQNDGQSGNNGIRFGNSNNSTILGNKFINNWQGINCGGSENISIINNTISNSGIYGICIPGLENSLIKNNIITNSKQIALSTINDSNYNHITKNKITNNGQGISILGSNNNFVSKNYIENNEHNGIKINGKNNIISENIISNSGGGCGIHCLVSKFNTIENNVIKSNYKSGILICDSSENIIVNNKIKDNWAGIDIFGDEDHPSKENIIKTNIIINEFVGLELIDHSFDNKIYDNLLYNPENVLQYGEGTGENIWNISKTSEVNIIGGQYIGGNYWSDYSGNDTDGDGIGDTNLPYNKNMNGGDYLPLVSFTESNLECQGTLSWTDIKPNKTVNSEFTISNVGSENSNLTWIIIDYPNWGNWSFSPVNGSDLNADDEPVIVEVTVIAPNQSNSGFAGEVKIMNKNNPQDTEVISVSMTTPKNKNNNPYFLLFQQIINKFPFLEILLDFLKG